MKHLKDVFCIDKSLDESSAQSDFAAVGIELLVRLAREELAPRLSLVFPGFFFSIRSPMEFWFLAAVASGLLSWGHFISSDIVELIAQILLSFCIIDTISYLILVKLL